MIEQVHEKLQAALEGVIDAFDRTRVIGSTKQKREQEFAPVTYKIETLHFLTNSLAPYLWEYVDRIETHYRAMCRLSPTNGHSFEQHRSWAESAIRVIRREIDRLKDSQGAPKSL